MHSLRSKKQGRLRVFSFVLENLSVKRCFERRLQWNTDRLNLQNHCYTVTSCLPFVCLLSRAHVPVAAGDVNTWWVCFSRFVPCHSPFGEGALGWRLGKGVGMDEFV